MACVNVKSTGNHKSMSKNNGSSICSFVETNGVGGNDPDVWSSLWFFGTSLPSPCLDNFVEFFFASLLALIVSHDSGNLFKAFSYILTVEESSRAFPVRHLHSTDA